MFRWLLFRWLLFSTAWYIVHPLQEFRDLEHQAWLILSSDDYQVQDIEYLLPLIDAKRRRRGERKGACKFIPLDLHSFPCKFIMNWEIKTPCNECDNHLLISVFIYYKLNQSSCIVWIVWFLYLYFQQSGVGMTGPLIDEEGYPRNDIDVYSVRTTRHEIICKY